MGNKMKKLILFLMVLSASFPVFAWNNKDSKELIIDVFILLIEEAAKDGKSFYFYNTDIYDVIADDPEGNDRYKKEYLIILYNYIYAEDFDFLSFEERENLYTAFMKVFGQDSYFAGDIIEAYHNK